MKCYIKVDYSSSVCKQGPSKDNLDNDIILSKAVSRFIALQFMISNEIFFLLE